MNFDNYLFRAHSIGKIMGGVPKPLTDKQEETYQALDARQNGIGRPLTKNQLATWGDLYNKKNAKLKLSDPAKKYLEQLVWEELTGRSKRILSKYLDKGVEAEEKSITLYSNVTDRLFLKNKERRTNEYFSGESDNTQNEIIRDIKTNWDFSTFPLTDTEIPKSDYEWQGRVYMNLWGYKKFELIYSLVDTPFRLINDEIRRLDWKHNIFDNEGETRTESIPLIVETICNHIYTEKSLQEFCLESPSVELKWFQGVFKEIPDELRIKTFKLDYCQEANTQLIEMVKLARVYMNSLLESLGGTIININRETKAA